MATKKNTTSASSNTSLLSKIDTVDWGQFVPAVGRDGKPLTGQQRAQAEAAIRAGANPQSFGQLSPRQLEAWRKAQANASQQKVATQNGVSVKQQMTAVASGKTTPSGSKNNNVGGKNGGHPYEIPADAKKKPSEKTDTKKDTTPKPTTIVKPPDEKPDDSWKEDLQNSYRTMAEQQIAESNREYDNAKSNADRQATSRGMGRSTYNNQILAGLDSEKTKAANKIRESAGAAYQQAALQQHNVVDQLNWQKTQAAQQQANWETSYYAGRQDAAQQQSNWQNQFNASRQDAAQQQQNWQAQYDASREDARQQQQNWQASFDASREDAAQQQANWQAQFDAQQAQQQWQNEYMQDEFKYKYNVGGAANGGGGSGGGTPAPSTPDPNKGKDPDPMPDPGTNPSGPTGIPIVDDIWNWIFGGNNNNNKK